MKANLTALTKIAMALLFLGVAFAQVGVVAQESSDMEKVKAASNQQQSRYLLGECMQRMGYEHTPLPWHSGLLHLELARTLMEI